MSAIIEVYAGAPFIFKNGDDDDSNNSNNSNKSSTNSDIAVFYNIFIPFNKSESELQSAYDVIKEQISQIGVGVKSPVTLFYVNIGERIDERRVSEICALYSHITCKLRQFYQAGFEDLTLAELYDHCQNRDESKVIYIHNKGSFHPKLEVRTSISQKCKETNNEPARAPQSSHGWSMLIETLIVFGREAGPIFDKMFGDAWGLWLQQVTCALILPIQLVTFVG